MGQCFKPISISTPSSSKSPFTWLMLCALLAGRALRAARSRRGARAHTRPHVPLLRDLRQAQNQRPAGAPTAHCSLYSPLLFSSLVQRAIHLAISFTLRGISLEEHDAELRHLCFALLLLPCELPLETYSYH